MLWRVLQENNGLPEEAIVCFANTGKEDEATLRFIDRCSKEWGVQIHWVERRFDEIGFERVTFETASRNGEPFEALIRKRNYLPNPVSRICTSELKIRAQSKYLASLDHFAGETYSAIENLSWVGI
jgi:3'-phosphoadenosine 5'-phosphosulfate sulfotransferase (PAPS reductase)/FAD synthetase